MGNTRPGTEDYYAIIDGIFRSMSKKFGVRYMVKKYVGIPSLDGVKFELKVAYDNHELQVFIHDDDGLDMAIIYQKNWANNRAVDISLADPNKFNEDYIHKCILDLVSTE